MALIIKVNMPNAGKDQKILIHGLGEFTNGKAVRITDEQAEQFRQMNGRPVSTYEEGQITGTEFQPGPPLTEANLPEGITVTNESAVKESPPDKTDQEEATAKEDDSE